jgi:hypothetical protein
MTLEQLAFDAAVRALDKQEAVLEEIRARTGALVASSAVVTAFLGNDALKQSQSWLAVFAIAAFVGTILASAFILVPRKDKFGFSMSASVLYERHFARKHQLDEVYRSLAYQLERAWKSNDRAIQPLFWAFRIGAIGLIVEVVSLALITTGTMG